MVELCILYDAKLLKKFPRLTSSNCFFLNTTKLSFYHQFTDHFFRVPTLKRHLALI